MRSTMATSSHDDRLPMRSRHSASNLQISVPDMDGSNERHPRELKVVFASTGCTNPHIVDDLLPRLAALHHVEMRAVLDTGFRGQDLIRAAGNCLTVPNTARGTALDNEDIESEAAELCEWANLLVLGPIDANTLAKMLSGHTDTLLLEILRSWNVSNKILLVPGMSSLMWENPMTKKQLTKIRRKWNFVQVLPPILWNFEDGKKKVVSWATTTDLVDAVHNQVDLMNIGHGMEVSPSSRTPAPSRAAKFKSSSGAEESPINLLPPELWTLIFDFTGDWELAQTMHIYTNLPPPAVWTSHTSPRGPRDYMQALELTILRGNLDDVKHFIATHSTPRWLSKLCIKLIMRFAMIPLLVYLEAEHKDLFWAMFGQTFLPDKASSVFGRTEILEFWRTSPSFLTKEYTTEALDGASRAGFVEVLEWWSAASLPLKFTEAALEQASSRGHIQVLEWWKRISATTTTASPSSPEDDNSRPILKPGKSICYATQSGHLPVLEWWTTSGLPFPHEDTVAKLASTHGHVSILQFWHALKGSKIIYDNQVLVGASKNGHVAVLEWWKKSGLRVEYKTMDVEEALEDGVEGPRGDGVRRWWARNGLNLGVGTSEWMKVKVLEG